MYGLTAGRADSVPGLAVCTDADCRLRGVPRGARGVPMGALGWPWVPYSALWSPRAYIIMVGNSTPEFYFDGIL